MKPYNVKHYKTVKEFGIFEFLYEIHIGELITIGDSIFEVKEVCHIMQGDGKQRSATLYVLEVKQI